MPNTGQPVIPWTEEEDLKIANYLKERNFKNLRKAFEDFANNPLNTNNRSWNSIAFRYYKHIKHNHDIFFTTSKFGSIRNTKIVARDQTPEYSPIEAVMRQLLDLDRRERTRVLEFFQNNP